LDCPNILLNELVGIAKVGYVKANALEPLTVETDAPSSHSTEQV